ncbi:MAG: hypothetical protein NWE94_05470 [Candidatus Bathyarchaeota archaeon]|nr:hypothetical protein [Candidatus Bathyarchaeota archaeon]
MPPKRKNLLLKYKKLLILAVAIACVIIAIVATLPQIPVGTCVYAVASTTPYSVDINGCELRTKQLINLNDPTATSATGNRAITMKIYNGETEIATAEKTNVGNDIGNYGIESPPLPTNLTPNTELRIVIQLKDANGNLISQAETTLTYK